MWIADIGDWLSRFLLSREMYCMLRVVEILRFYTFGRSAHLILGGCESIEPLYVTPRGGGRAHCYSSACVNCVYYCEEFARRLAQCVYHD